jgi:hypothetical protein
MNALTLEQLNTFVDVCLNVSFVVAATLFVLMFVSYTIARYDRGSVANASSKNEKKSLEMNKSSAAIATVEGDHKKMMWIVDAPLREHHGQLIVRVQELSSPLPKVVSTINDHGRVIVTLAELQRHFETVVTAQAVMTKLEQVKKSKATPKKQPPGRQNGKQGGLEVIQ